MNATLARLALASALIFSAHSALTAGEDAKKEPSAAEDSSGRESTSMEAAMPAAGVSVGYSDSGGKEGPSPSEPDKSLDPGSKCLEFPQMCAAQ